MDVLEATRISPETVAEHGLSEEEYARILKALGREPNLVELGIFSVMWSEHCSYKSSRVHLKKLPTEAPWVIQGPGENAGVIDIGDGDAAIFKMESHNHPSYIEPYQGAATGVGGILRDVFTMGARPVANLNALRFGRPDHPKTRHLVAGVVAGIGGYGNCVGVPTVGGEVNFDAAYDGNILVNAMTVGVAKTDKIFYSAATGVGGILRDVFTMGARPVANMNALRFGRPDHPKMRHLIAGVVHGIGGYGNCVGVPTVGGECNFHPSYNGNILVNAMTVGIADKNRIFY